MGNSNQYAPLRPRGILCVVMFLPPILSHMVGSVCGQVESSLSDTPAIISGEAKPLSAELGMTLPSDQNGPLKPAAVVSSVVPASGAILVPSVAPSANATAQDPFSRDVQQIVLRAMDNLDAQKLPRLDDARMRLARAIAEVEKYVVVDSPAGQAWSKFLHLEDIKRELESERPAMAKLTEFEMNMRQNYQGLDYAVFRELRDGLSGVVRALKYGTNPERTLEIFRLRMQELIEKLDAPPAGAGSERNSAIGQVASYMYESGQSMDALRELRAKFNEPNFQVTAREALLNRVLMRPVNKPSPVNECLLGTRIIGRACMDGTVSVDLLPMAGGVSMNLNLVANLSTINTGYNRGVVLRTTGASAVFASKQVFVTSSGISSSPATISAKLSTQVNAIEHRLRIVRRIAKKKAAEQKPLADRIAQGRMQSRIQREYDQEVGQQLTEANRNFNARPLEQRPEFERLGVSKPTFAFHSTDSSVNASGVQAAAFQISASDACKIPRPANADVVFEAHQSLAINTLESLLGARTIHHHDLDDLAKQFLGEVPDELMAEVNGKSWEVTFAAFNPVQIEFDDNQIKITLRVSRMQGEDRTLGSTVISAVYEPSYADGRLTLHRDGELAIDVPGVRSVMEATSLRGVVKAKFDTIFREEIVTEKINLAERFPNAPKLDVSSLNIDDGWIQVGLR